MPNAAESGVVSKLSEFEERAPFFRVCVTLPADLRGFILGQAKRFPGLRGQANVSAYFRSLAAAHRDSFTGNGKAKRRGRK